MSVCLFVGWFLSRIKPKLLKLGWRMSLRPDQTLLTFDEESDKGFQNLCFFFFNIVRLLFTFLFISQGIYVWIKNQVYIYIYMYVIIN